MKTKFVWLSEQRERIWFAALVNLAVLAVLLLIFRPTFETNDDMAIALCVSGAKGTYDAHLVYSSYLLGLVLSALYRLTSRVPWYSLLQYAVLFWSFTAIFHVIVRKQKNTAAVWISVMLIWIFAYEGYIRVQYTKTAGIASAAGILLLLYAAGQEETGREKAGRGLPVCGYLLACLGFMYREQQFLAELALLSGAGLFLLLDGRKKGAKEAGRRLRRCAGFFALLAVFVICLHAADRSAYRSPDWKEYLEYNDLRTELLDYGFPNYAENKDACRELGINRTAWRLYRGWNYADTEKFTPEVMRALIALKESKAFSLRLLGNFLRDVFPKMIGRVVFCSLFAIFLYCLYCAGHEKSSLAVIAYETVLGFLIYFALYYGGRYLVNRVDTGLCLACILVLLWTVPAGLGDFSSKTGAILLCAAVLLLQIPWKSSWRIGSAPTIERMRSERATLESIASDREHLYVAKTGAVSFAAAYGVFDPLPYGIAENILSLGGWPAFTPAYRNLMEEYKVTNPYRDLVGSDRLFLVDRDIETTLKYLRKYYDKTAQAVSVSEYPHCTVYRITAG